MFIDAKPDQQSGFNCGSKISERIERSDPMTEQF